MILGTANFCNEYRGKKIEKEECFKLLEYFESNGGKLIDTAGDYGDSQKIIEEYIVKYNSKLKILYKPMFIIDRMLGIEYYSFIDESYTEAIIWRGKVIDYRSRKTGQSIYYPHELDPKSKITIIPASDIFRPYIPVMKLHSEKIYIRSINTLGLNANIGTYGIDDIILGVDNMEQLKENMDKLYV